ncbi:hypothetical protein KC357_g9322 [Hortaea werneckii]|nr:hypothetical protein KC357_g9322 [Hortaea werneckii]
MTPQTRGRTTRSEYLEALQAPLRVDDETTGSRPSSSGSSSHQVLLKWKPEGTWRVVRRGAAIPRVAFGLESSGDSTPDQSEPDTAPQASRGSKRKRLVEGIEDTGPRGGMEPDDRATPREPTPTRPSQVEVAATQAPKAVHEEAAAWLAEALPASAEGTRRTMVGFLMGTAGVAVAGEWQALMEKWRLDGTCVAAPGGSEDEWQRRATRSRAWLHGRTDWDPHLLRIWDLTQQRKIARQLD